jgi:hypothetical protein
MVMTYAQQWLTPLKPAVVPCRQSSTSALVNALVLDGHQSLPLYTMPSILQDSLITSKAATFSAFHLLYSYMVILIPS